MDRQNWLRKRNRLKYKIGNTNNEHKLVIFRSNKHIYGQVINIEKGLTVISS